MTDKLMCPRCRAWVPVGPAGWRAGESVTCPACFATGRLDARRVEWWRDEHGVLMRREDT